ncbi:MAG: hypothetical protein J6K17_13620 [Oscillospiraceae bacterium]|nr:hypothetical protein [Oscillospiraceae bacterium]
MSKSIKDYKDAMDSVKISDSFYKRTEVLLTESSEMEVVKNTPSRIKLITHSAIAAAACLLVAFGVKSVIDSRNEADSAIVTEIYQETTVVTIPSGIPETASPVIDRPEEEKFLNDSGVMVGNMPEIPDVETDDAAEGTVAAEPTMNQSDYDFTNDSDDDISAVENEVIEEETEEAAPKAPVETTATTTAKEGYPEMAEPLGTENIPPLSETASDTVTVEVTPYFDMGAIKSGENPITGNGSEFSELISVMAATTTVSPTSENESFTTVFLVQLSEQASGLPYYTIYVTDAGTVVVTRHDIDNQRRFTYDLNKYDYDKILRLLYSEFGNENEYDYFFSTEIDN